MSTVKVADQNASAFYVDDEACPWVRPAVEAGLLRVLEEGPDVEPRRVITATEGRVTMVGPHAPGGPLLDFSRPCNWTQAAKVAAGELVVASGEEPCTRTA